MRLVRQWILTAVTAAIVLQAFALAAEDIEHKPLVYPSSPRGNVVDDYHGTKVPDPYRWLEDPLSAETRAWIKAQNELTFSFLEQIPAREQIRARLEKLWDYERYGLPEKAGDRYYYRKNDGLQNQSVIYAVDSLDGTPKVLLDPNKLSEDGTVSVSGTFFTEDGRYMAYSTSTSGSDWRQFKIRDTKTGKDLDDVIDWAKFTSAAWTPHGKGFFYTRYEEPTKGHEYIAANYHQKIYFHTLGTPQSEDKLIYERPDKKKWLFRSSVTDDGRYLTLTIFKGTEKFNRFFYKDLRPEGSEVVELINEPDAAYSFIDNDGPVFWFFTNLDAPRGKIIAIDLRKPGRENWKVIIPERRETLRGAEMINNQFVCMYLKDAYTQVRINDIDGKFIHAVEFPGAGTATGFDGERDDTETFYTFSSFTIPTTIFRYDMTTGKSTVFRRPDVDFDPSDFETKQVFYTSKDGTRVPMFITHRKGLQKDGTNPTYLYGYGGFNIPMRPRFSVANLVWMEMGGIHAMANIRGGGEYGDEWHRAGKLENKQNVFDDFIAAGEYLIEQKYTSTDKLAIGGGSNGGLLVGAVLNQRPDLFGAALPAVGVMDMLRFHKFTIGWAWVSDYGSSDDQDGFKTLYKYSPLQTIKSNTKYPSTMITTSDHDDRVVPAHSFKYAAALQAAQAGPNPILIRIQVKAGHGGGKPTRFRIEEAADKWAFLVRELGMDPAVQAAAQ